MVDKKKIEKLFDEMDMQLETNIDNHLMAKFTTKIILETASINKTINTNNKNLLLLQFAAIQRIVIELFLDKDLQDINNPSIDKI
jgi:hypothetical protein